MWLCTDETALFKTRSCAVINAAHGFSQMWMYLKTSRNYWHWGFFFCAQALSTIQSFSTCVVYSTSYHLHHLSCSCYDPLSQIRNTSLTSGSYISESIQDLAWMGSHLINKRNLLAIGFILIDRAGNNTERSLWERTRQIWKTLVQS